MTPILKQAALAFAVVTGAATAAAAQTTPPGHPTGRQRVPPQQSMPDSGQRPSESLSQSHGVIQPPPTGDSGVIEPKNRSHAPTPEIKPPGTPGGNPNVQPK